MSKNTLLNGQLTQLPMDRIISKTQVRKAFHNIEELAQSIAAKGLQSPITVTYSSADDRYVILQGERRWRACQLLGMKAIDAIVREDTFDENERIFAQLTENIQREEMSCEEIAKAIQMLFDQGFTSFQIATALGKNRSWPYVYASLSELPPQVAQLRDKYQINDPYVLRPLKLIFEMDEEKATRLVEKAQRHQIRFTREIAQGFLNQIQRELGIEKKTVDETEGSDGNEGNGKNDDSAKDATSSKTRSSDHVRVYCWVRLPGASVLRLGILSNDRVANDSEYVCVELDGKRHVVSLLDVAMAGVKDIADSTDDLY